MTREGYKRAITSEDLQEYSIYSISKVANIPVSTLYKWQQESEIKDHVPDPIRHKKDYSHVIEEIKRIKGNYPYFGYRRIYAYLKHKMHHRISQKTVYKLMKEEDIMLERYKRSNHSRQNTPKPVVNSVNQYWQIDMTTGYLEDGTPIYTIGIIDVFSREILSLKGSYRARSSEWLLALDEAIKNKFPDGLASGCLVLGSDNGCQPTSRHFRETCKTLKIDIHYTGYKNPKENGNIERFFRTLKEEHLWLSDFNAYDEYCAGLEKYKDYYNNERMHSSLGYRSPNEFIENYFLEEYVESNLQKC